MYIYYDKAMEICLDMLEKSSVREKSQSFYKRHIENFFSQYMSYSNNEKKPINAITYYDIDTYLESRPYSDSDKLNSYNSLKKFFEYTYNQGITPEIMSQVTKPNVTRKNKSVMSDGDYERLKEYVVNKSNPMNERLLLGLFLFTGLSRQYISNLKNSSFLFENGVYKLEVIKDEDVFKLPLKAELQLVINEYCLNLNQNDIDDKVFKIDENYLSSVVGDLCKKVIGKKYSPTVFSNTFIALALSNGNYVWEVSNLVLESVSSVAQHITDDAEQLEKKQTSILNSF